MASRYVALVAGLCVLPAAAAADGLVIPGIYPQSGYAVRPSYRQAYNHYPPPQHGFFGQPVPPPSPYDRPSYDEAYDAFPPPGGRYGGGIVEYVLTGGRPEPIAPPIQAAPPVYVTPAYVTPAYVTPAYVTPAYVAPAYIAPAYVGPVAVPLAQSPDAVLLPRSSLPDYAPQPPAYYGASPVGP